MKMKTREEWVSPIGRTAAEAAENQAKTDLEYRALRETHAAARAIAKQVIHHRTRNALSQQDLAKKIGTSHSQVSRIESGRHMPSVETLRRISEALDLNLIIILEPKDVAERHASSSKPGASPSPVSPCVPERSVTAAFVAAGAGHESVRA